VSDDSLAQCISDLRNALNDIQRRIIKTVTRRGYLFAAPVSISAIDDKGIRFVGSVQEHQEASIFSNRTASDQSDRGLAAFDQPSVAVVPFTNISRNPEQDYFVDGITEEIITALARIRWFPIIACPSTLVDKAKATDVKHIGSELGVRYVLEGSVRKAGQRVRIGAQLVDAATGAHLWADNFDGSLQDVFALQHEGAVNLAGVIEPALQAAEIRRAVDRPTAILTAYDLYLRALALFTVRKKPEIIRALELLGQAIESDPYYGPALALAASCHVYLHIGAWSRDPETDRRYGLDLARRALQVAGEDPRILARCAYVLASFGEDIDAALGLVERSLELNAGFALGWNFSGWLRLWAGQPERAVEDFERHQRLRRLKPTNHPGIGVGYFFARRFEEARKALLVSLHDSPDWVPTYRFLAACCAQMGRLDEAREIIERLRPLTQVIGPVRPIWRNPADRELFASGLKVASTQAQQDGTEEP
jgi:TolB-like protein